MPRNLAVDDEFRTMCREIVAEDHSEEEWSEIESDDMFQSESYVGGFEETEQAFTFSHYAPDGQEYWFQLTLGEVRAIAAGENPVLDLRPAGS
jgi:hypothetical protein